MVALPLVHFEKHVHDFVMKIICFLLLLVVIPFNHALAANEVGKAMIVKGDVKFVSKGNEKPLLKGQSLLDGDRVVTQASSLALIRLKDGSHLKLGSDSEVVIQPPRSKGVRLEKGSLFAKVRKSMEKKQQQQFKVRTKSAVAGVRGTEFFTSYGTKEDDVWLCVNEGSVEVTSKGFQPVLVRQGEGISVTAKGVSQPKPLPWTKKLNWNMNPESKDLENKVDIESAYTDLLDQDYD